MYADALEAGGLFSARRLLVPAPQRRGDPILVDVSISTSRPRGHARRTIPRLINHKPSPPHRSSTMGIDYRSSTE
jgi:hypothetical protein